AEERYEVAVRVAEALGPVRNRRVAVAVGLARAVPLAVPRAPVVVHFGAELEQDRDLGRARGGRPGAELRVEVAVEDVLEREALLREPLRPARPVQRTRVGLKDDVGDLTVAPDREHLRARETQALVPVLGEVHPGDVAAG